MQHAADASPAAALVTPPADRPVRLVPPGPTPADDERERLVLRLAADRLRDLRDDGVTSGYIARLYGVDPALVETLAAELAFGGRR